MSTFSFILGDWSRNIGNAFFQLGGFWTLRKIYPNASFSIICEQPGYPSYWNPKGGNPKNYFDIASAVKTDYLVLMGPMFRPETMSIWGDSLGKILSQGTKLVLLGIGAMRYDQESIENYRAFLKKYPPFIMTSRDTDTFELLSDLATHSYNGIDYAFFIPDFYQINGFANLSSYVAINFDKVPEPEFKIFSNSDHNNQSLYRTFKFRQETWGYQVRGWRYKLATKSRVFMFVEGILFPGPQNKRIGSYDIVRTDHRPHPMVSKKTFRSPNVMVNDTPYPYFEVYGNAELTISNRLHACIIALAYGKPAMLFSASPRTRLLERLRLENITKHPVSLDLDLLGVEKKKLLTFLLECFDVELAGNENHARFDT